MLVGEAVAGCTLGGVAVVASVVAAVVMAASKVGGVALVALLVAAPATAFGGGQL